MERTKEEIKVGCTRGCGDLMKEERTSGLSGRWMPRDVVTPLWKGEGKTRLGGVDRTAGGVKVRRSGIGAAKW